MYQKPSEAKQAARERLAADIEAYLAQGREIPLVDHTANRTWKTTTQDTSVVLDQVLAPSKNMGGKTGFEVKRKRGQQVNRRAPSCSSN